MLRKTALAAAVLLACCSGLTACGKDGETSGEKDYSLWDFSALSAQVPEVREAGYSYNGGENIEGIYFTGAEYNGEKTEIFAYLGVPETQKPADGYPAMVLVHGGLGQAYADWVKLWTDRGYVALSLSVDANYTDSANKAAANPKGGPNISVTAADMTNPKNSWEYISVANIIACNNILRGRDDVDESNIGITGISWGSYLTCITVGVDNRFKFGIPVYGAGYMDEDPTSELAGVFAMDDAALNIYRERFAPAAYMKNCEIPLMWFAGANDFAFSLACNQKCADLNKGKNFFSWRDRLTHGQQPGDGSGLPEIFDFADYQVSGAEMLRADEGTFENGTISLNVSGASGKIKAELFWSSYPLEYWHDSGNVWTRGEAACENGKVTVSVPEEALFAFVKVTDEDGGVVSSRCFSF